MGTNHEISIEGLPSNKTLVLFDGICTLCNRSVDFLIKRDNREEFYFSSLQSDIGQYVLNKSEMDSKELNSLLIVRNGRVYKSSRGVLEIVVRMRRLWPLLYIFIIVPFFLRDPIYNYVARNRYKWYGKRDTCRIATQAEKNRFLG